MPHAPVGMDKPRFQLDGGVRVPRFVQGNLRVHSGTAGTKGLERACATV